MADGSGRTTIVAAAVLGLSVLAAALVVQVSLDRVVEEMQTLRAAFEVASEQDRGPADARPSRPDPRRRYSVNTDGVPIRGDADAGLSIVEFSDFECPFCNRVNPTLMTVLEEYDGKVRILWKHLPLVIHKRARDAHLAAEAAHRQGKFWEMHDKIFADQRRMSPDRYRTYAEELGLDLAQFDRDVADPSVARRVDADLAEAARLGVSGTPSFLVNGRFVSGALPIETFRALIDAELGAAS